jgi:hypothetical protein
MKLHLDRLDPAIRRLLRLPPEPFPNDFYLEPNPNGRGGRFVSPSTDEWTQEMDRWHADPAAARALEQLLRVPYLAEGVGRSLRSFVNGRRLERDLKQARVIVFDSHYLHVLGETPEVEGFLQAPWWGREHGIWLTITTPEMVRLQAESAWGDGEVWAQRQGERSFEHRIVVPVETLSPAIVHDALERWYMQRFEWERGHWAVAERRLPKFLLRLDWQELPSDEPERAQQAAERLARAEAALAAIEEWPAADRTRALFGR